ncbi:MAG: type I DNA topoisomerase [Planctomycetota bacterium]
MATRKKHSRPLVIVESPAKAKTIGKFLGSDYHIEASIGHVRDLPANASQVPAALKKEKWGRLGIDVDSDFKPVYVVPPQKKAQVRKLKAALASASELLLATDEDREGESISWHLVQELKPKCAVKRLVFHEITKSAILDALAHPRDIDQDLVEAQETRRIVDRLYGYTVSPLLWKKVRPQLSAGRVQSVAIRLIVEREGERIRFRPADYWSIEGTFGDPEDQRFSAQLTHLGEDRVATGRDFEQESGRLKNGGGGLVALDEERATRLVEELGGKRAKVASSEKKPYSEKPYPPFTTSTLQQESARKLRFSAQRTMRAAQRLYENGYITYMRTDSTALSDQAVKAARSLIAREYGPENLPDSPRTYQTKVKNAQEAHEAIRPAGSEFVHPRALGHDMGEDERRLYDLIYRRSVACQMKDARGHRTVLQLVVPCAGSQARFQASGKTIDFPGYRLAYVEDIEDADSEIAEAERILPDLAVGQEVESHGFEASGHTTQPPPRLTEAGLIKELEARGIGRPSTYASIIETIVAREYCFKRGSALVPTFTAFAVVGLLSKYLGWLVDYEFTAKMEDDLDEISNGRARRLDYLRTFFLGNGSPGLRDRVAEVEQEIDPREVCSIPLGEDEHGQPVEVRVGRYGPYVSRGDQRASVPNETAPDELTLEKALQILAKGGDGPKRLGVDPETGLDVFVKIGRFGPYFQLGEGSPAGKGSKKTGKPRMASLLAGMDPEHVTIEDALAVLSLPRTVGVLPTGGGDEPVLAQNGRYGPYLKWGSETRSIPEGLSPLTITLDQAKELFAQPKQGRGGARARSLPKVVRVLGENPDSGAEVRLLDGRYGLYVTDGITNASLLKGEGQDLSLERALELIRERAARGPARKKSGGRRAAKAGGRSGKSAGGKRAVKNSK